MRLSQISLSSLIFLLLPPAISHADDTKAIGTLQVNTPAPPPKPADVKPVDVKPPVIWKASAQIGAYGSYGNAQTVTVNGAITASRMDGKNKISLEALGAYSQAWMRAAGPVSSDGKVISAADRDAVNDRTKAQSAANWLFKPRYDRFLTERNSLYVLAFVGQDYVVEKDVAAGGGIGYSRLLLKSPRNELVVEGGYDLGYTHYQPAVATPWTLMHALRLFVGYVLTLRKDTAINASAETLINCNPMDIGPAGDPNTHKGFAQASRLIVKAGLTTVLYKKLSFKVGATVKYDNAPTPVDVILPEDAAGNPLPYAPGVAVLRNDNVDFIGEAAFIVSFL